MMCKFQSKGKHRSGYFKMLDFRLGICSLLQELESAGADGDAENKVQVG